MRCLNCGSPRIEEIETENFTGVVAPTGEREYRLERAYRCMACGAIEEEAAPPEYWEEEPEWVAELRETFQALDEAPERKPVGQEKAKRAGQQRESS